MYFAYRQPETFRGVVGGMYFHVAFYTAKIEHVERVDIDAGIAVDIWNAEEIAVLSGIGNHGKVLQAAGYKPDWEVCA